MTWEQLRSTYMPILTAMSMSPRIDPDGDIHFVTEDGNYYITGNCDDRYFTLLYPGFWEINGPGELSRASLAISKVNRTTKLGKLTISEDLKDVHAETDFLLCDPSGLALFLDRALEAARSAVTKFRSEMDEN